MSGHEFAGICERGEEGEFAAQNGGGTDDGEAAGVFAGVARFGATEEFHIFLHERQVFSVADGAYDDVREGAGEIQIGHGTTAFSRRLVLL